jgi:2-polyprenyl-3-methyl-5-hydroxy-6-metoxy-1,4-benzoquinol methylase
MLTSNERFNLQDNAYHFPYHYLPEISDDKITIFRSLGWGLEYMTYLIFVRDMILNLRPQSICDIGCGEGRLLSMLDSVPRRVGIDLSAKAILFAQAFTRGVNKFCCAMDDDPGAYDVVSCIETLEHIADDEVRHFVESLHAKVVMNGKLIVCVPTINNPLNPKHLRHYTEYLLRTSLEPYFRIQEITWLFRKGMRTKILNHLLSNRYFLLQHAPSLRKIWQLHRNHSFLANSSDGTHLVALATPR